MPYHQTICLVVLSLLTFHVRVDAQSPTASRISFRLGKPAVSHFQNEQQAAENEKTLTQLGCQVKRHQHDGHIDVAYECPLWQTVVLKDASEVEQWEKYLRTHGFFVVNNQPNKSAKEMVKYQLAGSKTFHFHKADEAKAHVAMFKMLGCEVSVAQHSGHEDVTVKSIGWRALGLADHKEAHEWEIVLKQLGFQTLHEHGVSQVANRPAGSK